MAEEIEIIEEVEEFEEVTLSKSQEIEIKKMVEKAKELRVEEVLLENDARFFGICPTFEETMKRSFLAGFEFKLEDANLILVTNENEIYYMVLSDLSTLSSDIKYFRNKVLDIQGSLNSEFEKVELNFSSANEDLRFVLDTIESIEITK